MDDACKAAPAQIARPARATLAIPAAPVALTGIRGPKGAGLSAGAGAPAQQARLRRTGEAQACPSRALRWQVSDG